MRNFSPMKHVNKLTMAFALIGLISLSSCNSQGGKDLSPVQQSRNMYQNATAMTSGIMIFAFNQTFQEALGSKVDTTAKTAAPVEEMMKIVPEKIVSSLGSLDTKFDSVFNAIQKEHPKVYQKMFSSEKAKEALKITDNAQLPDGFKPMTQHLTKDDMEKYLVYIMGNSKAKGKENNDPVINYFKNALDWQKELTDTFKSDPDISAIMKKK